MTISRLTRATGPVALVVALLALLLAVAGTSYAAASLAKNSVGTKQLKAGAVTTAKVKDASLTAADFAPGQLAAGSAGPAGPQGAKGDKGADAVTLTAVVSEGGALLGGSGAVAASRNGTGEYAVTFDRAVRDCVPVANVGGHSAAYIPAVISTYTLESNDRRIGLRIERNADATAQDRPFYLAVTC